MDERTEQRAFLGLNLAVTPIWVAMIVAPRSRLTARLVDASGTLLAGYCAAYTAQLAGVMASGPPADMRNVKALRESLAEPRGFLTGWTHFLAFDLFVGRWIWRTALDEGRSARLALVMTLMAGPAGLGLFSLQRRLRP